MKNKQQAIIVTGQQYIERPDTTTPRSCEESTDYVPENLVAFGFKNLQITVNGITKPISKDDDKFIVYSENLETARAEFWSRWQQFVRKAFNRTFVPIMKNQ